MNVALVASVLVAGAVGAVIRYSLSRALASRSTLPIAVIVVNVVGSALGGGILALSVSGGMSDDLRLVLLTGLCGGLTTFSTFSVETVQLAVDGRTRVALASALANLVIGVGAAAIVYLAVMSVA